MKKVLFLPLLFILTLCSHSNSSNFQSKEGFLKPGEAPNSLTILLPPPSNPSAEFSKDIEEYQKGKLIRDTSRGKQAIIDTDSSTKGILKGFSKTFGIDLSLENTPEIYELINKALIDAKKYSTVDAKKFYNRKRPFVYFGEHTCNLTQEEKLKNQGSYPSGHTSKGWTTALILAEINPNYKDIILNRGIEYGISRIICGFHWKSDVDAGRITGEALVVALNKNTLYQKQLQKAKQEFKSNFHFVKIA